MDMLKKLLMLNNAQSDDSTLDPTLIFYAPMSEGDLTDHVT